MSPPHLSARGRKTSSRIRPISTYGSLQLDTTSAKPVGFLDYFHPMHMLGGLRDRVMGYVRPILDHTDPFMYFPFADRKPKPISRVDFSTAENWLLRPELAPKFKEYINRGFDIQDLSYSSGLGGPSDLLAGLADYFNDHFEPVIPVKSEHLVTAPGATHLLESLFYHLVDPGEGVLISTPYWPGFDEALSLRNNIKAVKVNIPFDTAHADFFGPKSVEYYKKVIEEHPEIQFRGLIICNPQNPIGGCYTRETLKAFLRFAEDYDLHVVVDELYGLSVFQDNEEFVSVLNINLDELGVDKSRVHIVYSFSKDLGSSGIRLGILVTQSNPSVHNSLALGTMQSKVSTLTSIVATHLLQEKEFLSHILEANPRRLQENYKILESFLNFYKIQYVPPKAGLFTFINFLAAANRPGRPHLTEKELDQAFKEAGVKLSAGKSFHTYKSGWFRLIFSVEKEKLKNGLWIIERVLGLKGWIPPNSI